MTMHSVSGRCFRAAAIVIGILHALGPPIFGQHLVSGRITTDDGVAPYGIAIQAHRTDVSGGSIYQAYTLEDGRYAASWPAGTYNLYADPSYSIYPPTRAYVMYRPEWYDDAFFYAQATPVVVGSGSPTTNLNFNLARYAEIRGMVRSVTTLAPISGVTVRAYDTSYSQIGGVLSTRTGTNGAYALFVNEGTWRIYADPEGLPFAPRYYSNKVDQASADLIPVALNQIVADINFDLPVSAFGTINGFVFGPDGAPLAGAQVNAYGNDYSGSAVSDALGFYQMTTVRADTYRVRAYHEMYPMWQYYCGQWGWEFSHPVSLSAGIIRSNINFRLAAPGSISGVVTDTLGAPIPGVTMTAWSRSGWNAQAETETDGSYQIHSLAPGDYRVQANTEFSSSNTNVPFYLKTYYQQTQDAAEADLVSITSGEQRTGIDLELARGGFISGVLSNAAGYGQDNVQIYAWPDDVDFFNPGWVEVETTYSTAGGQYEIRRLTPGHYRLQVQGSDSSYNPSAGSWYQDHRAYLDADVLDMTATDRYEHINVWVYSEGRISGRVTNSSGSGLREVSVMAVTTNGHVASSMRETDSSGNYTIRSLAPGTYVIVAIPMFYNETYNGTFGRGYHGGSSMATATRILLAHGEQRTGVNIGLATVNGRIAGRVTRAVDGVALAGRSLYAIAADAPFTYAASATTDGSGNYTMRGLPPGDYHVLVHVNSSDGYAFQYFSNRSSRATADRVSVGSTTVSGVVFRLEEAVPYYVPGMLAPLCSVRDQPIVFFWKEVDGARLYEIQVDDLTAGSTTVIAQAGISGLSWTSTVTLITGHHYQVRARGGNSAGYGEWGPHLPFTVLPPLQYQLSVSIQGPGSVTLDPEGGWYDPGAVVTLSAVEQGGYPFDHWVGVDSSPVMITAVVTMDTDRAVSAYFVDNRPPEAPEALAPTDGITVGLTPMLDASSFYDPEPGDTHAASHWQLTRFDDGFGQALLDTQTVATTQLHVPPGMLVYTTYSWRVRYQDQKLWWSLWSDAATFQASLEIGYVYVPAGQEPQLDWPTQFGYLYTVYVCHDLSDDQWDAVGGYIDIPGDGGVISVTLPADEERPGFYRIEMRLAP